MTTTRLHQKINAISKVDNEDEQNDGNFNSLQQDQESIDSSITTDRETSLHVTSWVRANYIQEREHNVPRKNMYEHYKGYCTSNNLTPVNSATFGKLLRNVFPDLKTRRLGVRGQSKYHYCGIRVRNEADQPITTDTTRFINTPTTTTATTSTTTATKPVVTTSSESPIPTNPGELPSFAVPNVPAFQFNDELDPSIIANFTALYERHCRDMLFFVTSNQVDKIRDALFSFYNELPASYVQLIQTIPEINEAIWRWDCTLYDTIINRFLPHVNQLLTHDTTVALRSYTREIRGNIEAALTNYPLQLVQKKLDVARIFSAKFRRQLSLNFAAQNASTILNDPRHVALMQEDWDHFDFDSILDQTLWVCDCDTAEIRQILYREVHELLTSRCAIEHWMNWMSSIVNKYLRVYTPNHPNEASGFVSRSKQLLLKWNFYTTLIMKDLTLQQARSFGQFQSLRLFLDDYMLYLVEENIAQVNFALMHYGHKIKHTDNALFYTRSAESSTPTIISNTDTTTN